MTTNKVLLEVMNDLGKGIRQELKLQRKEQIKLRKTLQHMKPNWDMNLYEYNSNHRKVMEIRKELDALECDIATRNVQLNMIDIILEESENRND